MIPQEVSNVRIEGIKSRCAWRSCVQTFKGITCPPGWRHIVMSQGSLLKHSNLMSADRDGVLCPTHYVRVNSLLVDV